MSSKTERKCFWLYDSKVSNKSGLKSLAVDRWCVLPLITSCSGLKKIDQHQPTNYILVKSQILKFSFSHLPSNRNCEKGHLQ
jgi:hypothetical protein